jgi:tetratricopeptide (TPR) repeat protein
LAREGRFEEAFAATQQAVGIREGLAHAKPHIYLPDFAKSLSNLSVMLNALDRGEEALAASQKAVEVYHELAEANPQGCCVVG